MGLIEFVSLQDLKGSMYFGGEHEKLREVKNIEWDMLVIDEAHEGVDTYKTDVAFDHIKRKWTLHLSGTPFKALANALPFLHCVLSGRAAVAGHFSDIFPHLWWVIAYALVTLAVAVAVFHRRMRTGKI